jgi:hypothetical protein
MQDKALLKIWILIFLIIFIGGGYWIWRHQKASSETVEIKSQIKSLEIIPSQHSENGITYQEGAKAVVMGINLSNVGFYQRGGEKIYFSAEGELIGGGTKTEVKDGKEKWESPSLPISGLFVEFCAVGFNAGGSRVGEVCLSDVYGQTQEELQQEAQKLQNKILLDNCIADVQKKYDETTNNYWDSCIGSSGDSEVAVEACAEWADKKEQEISPKFQNLRNQCYQKYPL